LAATSAALGAALAAAAGLVRGADLRPRFDDDDAAAAAAFAAMGAEGASRVERRMLSCLM
jgi:hypothetical protein